MIKFRSHFARLFTFLATLIAAAFLTVGCSLFDPPTASNESPNSSPNLWTPSVGDEIVAGRPIPMIMDEEYWETPGMVNPSLRGLSGIAPIPIDGVIGGTVTLGNHSFVVPAGAVTGIVNFTLALASTNAIAVDCGPSPLSFLVPVRLSLSYAGTQYDPDYCARAGIEPLDASQLDIWYVSPDGGYERMDSDRIFDPSTKSVTVNVLHFSRYIIA